MTHLVGIAGSLRRDSLNAKLLLAAARIDASATVDVASIADIPLYNGDVEADGIPKAVTELKQRIEKSAGVLLVTPEYNNSVPGVLKNAIDWLSRPTRDIPAVFGNKPFAIIGATPGRGGTLLAQAAWLPVLRHLGARLWTGSRVTLSLADKAFYKDGHLVDDDARQQLVKFMQGFVSYCTASSK